MVNSHWTPEEHCKWGEMLKNGFDVKTIAMALKTKTEHQCSLRALVVHKQPDKCTLSSKFPVDEELRKAVIPVAKEYFKERRMHH